MKTLESPTNPHAAGKAAHTEGSWHIGLAATERAVYGKYGEHIATLPDMLASDEVTANARLIAAAPELLEALNVIARASERSEKLFGGSMSEVTRVFENITRVARAAIARATGQGGGE